MNTETTRALAQAWQALQDITPIRAIHNEADYDRTVELANALCDEVGEDTDNPLFPLFDLVLDLIREYETRTPFPPPFDNTSPI